MAAPTAPAHARLLRASGMPVAAVGSVRGIDSCSMTAALRRDARPAGSKSPVTPSTIERARPRPPQTIAARRYSSAFRTTMECHAKRIVGGCLLSLASQSLRPGAISCVSSLASLGVSTRTFRPSAHRIHAHHRQRAGTVMRGARSVAVAHSHARWRWAFMACLRTTFCCSSRCGMRRRWRPTSSTTCGPCSSWLLAPVVFARRGAAGAACRGGPAGVWRCSDSPSWAAAS